MVTVFRISSYCQSDVKTQSTDIYANILFSIPYSKFDITDISCLLTFTEDDQFVVIQNLD